MKILSILIIISFFHFGCQENQKEIGQECDQINNEAVRLFMAGETRSSLRILDSLTILCPDYSTIYLNKGYIYDKIGNRDSAIHYYSYCIEKDPELSEAWFNRGALYDNSNEDELAFKDYMEAYDLGLQNKYLFNNLSNKYLDKRNLDIALDIINKAIEIDDQFAIAYDTKAMILSYQNKYNEALKKSINAIRLNPERASFFNNRASIYNNLEDYKSAIKDCEKAIKIDKNYPYSYNTLGLSMDRTNKPAEAIGYYEKAIALKPDFVEAIFNLGVSYIKQGESIKACKQFNKAIELGDDFKDNKYYNFYLENCK